MTAPFDPRLTMARPDLAAAALRGKVEAERYVEGERYRVIVDVLDVKRRPRPDSPLDTQLLYGETATVYEDDNGWGWAQAERDGYVGYVAMSGLRRDAGPVPTHRVVVGRTFVYPAPDMKQPVLAALPLDANVHVEAEAGLFQRIEGRGYVISRHLAPLADTAPDFVVVAERLIGVPYLWGGKSTLGIDCSGLVQLSCSLAGRSMPRDTDMQETVGETITDKPFARGDLIFWLGHVGIAGDAKSLIHANAYQMLVSCEPIEDATARIFSTTGSSITSVRRLHAFD